MVVRLLHTEQGASSTLAITTKFWAPGVSWEARFLVEQSKREGVGSIPTEPTNYFISTVHEILKKENDMKRKTKSRKIMGVW